MKAALAIRISAFVFLATISVFSQSKNRILQWAEIPISNRNTVGAAGTQLLAQIEVLEIKEISVAMTSVAA